MPTQAIPTTVAAHLEKSNFLPIFLGLEFMTQLHPLIF